MNSFKSQQHRWAKGSIQTCRKLLPHILRSNIPVREKAEAFFHLTANFNYPLMCVLSVLMAPSMVIRYNMGWYEMLLIDVPLFFAATASVANFYMVCQRELHHDWITRLKYLPFLMSIGIGLTVNNTKAVFEAIFNQQSEFARTPKYRIEAGGDEWIGKKYRQNFVVQPIIELALGLYFTATVFYALANGIYGTVPFLVLFQIGFLYTGLLSIIQQYAGDDDAVELTPRHRAHYGSPRSVRGRLQAAHRCRGHLQAGANHFKVLLRPSIGRPDSVGRVRNDATMIRVLFADDDPESSTPCATCSTGRSASGTWCSRPIPMRVWPSSSATPADVVVSDLAHAGASRGAGFLAAGARALPGRGAHRALRRGPSRDGAAGDRRWRISTWASRAAPICWWTSSTARPASTPISTTARCAASSPASPRLPSVPHLYLEITQARGARRCHARRDHGRRRAATPRWWRRCCRWGTRRGLAAGAVSRQSARRCSFSAPTCCAAWRSADRRSGP